MSEVAYDAILGSGNTLRQVTRSNYQLNAQVIAGRASGAPDPSTLYGGPAEPRVTLETMDLAGVLSLLSVTAGSGLVTSGFTIPYNQRANGATFASGASHFTLSCSRGLAYPTTFQAAQDEEGATANVEVVFLTADGTNPVSINVNQSLAAQAFNAQFALGEAHVNGNALNGVIGVSVDTGLRIVTRRYQGFNWPSRAWIVSRDPTLTIRFEDFADLSNFNAGYATISSAAVYFRRRSDGAEFVADGTASHISFSFAAGVITPTVDASSIESGEATLTLTGKALTASNTATIP